MYLVGCLQTNNLEIIARAAQVLDVPLALLVGYVEEQDVYEWPVAECCDDALSDMDQIRPDDVPVGTLQRMLRGDDLLSQCVIVIGN